MKTNCCWWCFFVCIFVSIIIKLIFINIWWNKNIKRSQNTNLQALAIIDFVFFFSWRCRCRLCRGCLNSPLRPCGTHTPGSCRGFWTSFSWYSLQQNSLTPCSLAFNCGQPISCGERFCLFVVARSGPYFFVTLKTTYLLISHLALNSLLTNV